MSEHPERVGAERDKAPSSALPETAVRRAPSSAPARPAAVLTVGHADDPMEKLADSMADRAVASLDAAEPHRHSPGCGHLRRSVAPSAGATVGLEGGDLDTDASGAIERARGGGRALPTDVRRRMEGAFGTSLSHVRVHDGPQAAKLSSAMQASAFTTGSDVFFGAGQFDPSSREGEHVLAHELAHVLTEGPGSVRRIVIRRNLFGKAKSFGARLFGSEKAKEKAEVVEASKKVEKEELARGQKERIRGNEGRAEGVKTVYGDDPEMRPKTDADREGVSERLLEYGHRYEATMQLERDKFAELQEKYGDSKTEEEIAEEAYAEIWLNAPNDIRSRRPARETRVERLLRQVRQAQSGAQSQQDSVDNVADQLKLGQMLSKTVEAAYEAMVIESVSIMAGSQTKTGRSASSLTKPPMTEAQARVKVRSYGVEYCKKQAKVRKHKTPRELPEMGSKIDDAAWEAAKTRVDLRKLKKEQDDAAIDRLQSQLGGDDDAKDRQKDTADVAGTSTVNTVTGIASSVGGATSAAGEKVAEAPGKLAKFKAFLGGKKAPKETERDKYDTPETKFDQGTDGAQAAGGIITKLAEAVSEAMSMANHVKAAVKSGDPWEAVKATKAGLGSTNGLVNAASETAKLSRSIQPSLAKEVAGVIPGLGVATAVIDVTRAVLDVAMAGRRMHETDTALYDARARTSGDEADVMVWPLMKMSQAHTKSLENNVWGLGKSIFDLGASIAELGTAGAAKVAKTVGSVIDGVHSLGHLIADEILTWRAKRAKKLSSVMHLEGAAQDELRMHPQMAVDAIIVQASQGDEKAVAYLCNYYVDGKQVTPELVQRIQVAAVRVAPKDTGKVADPKDIKQQDTGRDSDDIVLIKIRNAVLEDMNTEGDPKSIFDKLRAGVAAAKGGFGLGEKWSQTGEMAKTRNAHASDEDFAHSEGADRGFMWRVKMMLKGEEKFKRSVAKTQVLQDIDAAAEEKAQKKQVKKRKELPDGVSCAIGPHKLPLTPSPEEVKTMFAKATDQELKRELKRTPPRNSEGWLDLMREELKLRKDAAAAKKAKKAEKKAKQTNSAPSGSKSSKSSKSSTKAKA